MTERRLAIMLAACAVAGCGDSPGGNAGADAAQATGAAAPVRMAAAEGGGDAVARGRYLVTIMDCAGCHNEGAMSPDPKAGYLEGGTTGFEMRGMGIFWPPNLTPHPQAGIGAWSEAEIITALRTGVRPDGRQLAPVMPWPHYAALTDADAGAIAAYLKSLPPSPRKVPAPATPETATAPYVSVQTPAPRA